MTGNDVLRSKARFFVLIGATTELDRLAGELRADKSAGDVVIVDGTACADKAAFMTTIASALSFPAHFGRNWDAFNDSFDERSWQPPHRLVLAFKNAERLLADSDSDLDTLFELLAESFGESADKPNAQLKVLFQVADPSAAPRLETRIPA